VTVDADPFDSGQMTAYDVAFDWDGESRHASFVFDISESAELSPASSSPAHGWVTWLTAARLVVAWEHPERDESRASTIELDDPVADDEPTEEDWKAIALAITLDVMSDPPVITWKYLGNVEVDSGTLLVGDPAYVLPHAEQGKPGVDYADLVLSRAADRPAAKLPVVLVDNFGGDGSFPVYGDVEDGELYRLSVAFVEPEE